MNFFKRQDEARRASRRLVVLFSLAVVAVVAAVDLVVFLLMRQGEAHAHGYMPPLTEWLAVHPRMVVGTTLMVLAIIVLASTYKTMLLGGGGGVVARSLGGDGHGSGRGRVGERAGLRQCESDAHHATPIRTATAA